MKRFIFRVVNMVTVFCFIFSSFTFLPQSYAKTAEPKTQTLAKKIPLAKDISIPEDLGRISKSYTSATPNAPLIIHIQDLHTNYEAQKKLSKTIEHLARTYGVSLILVEGGSRSDSLTFLRTYAPKDIRIKVAEKYLKEGKICGENYLDIVSDDLPLDVFGIEKPELYDSNMSAFLEIEKFNQRALNEITSLKLQVDFLKEKIYSNPLKEFDQKRKDFKDEKLDAINYITYLNGKFPASADQTLTQNLSTFNQLTQLEKQIDFEAVNNEHQTLLEKLSVKISKKDLESLTKKALEVKAGKVSSKDYYTYLKQVSGNAGISLEKPSAAATSGLKGLAQRLSKAINPAAKPGPYQNLINYIAYLELVGSIDHDQLFKEIKQVEKVIEDNLARNEDQKELLKISNNLELLSNLLQLKITPDDYDYFITHKDELKTANYLPFLKKNKVNVSPAKTLDANLDKLASFYTAARQRDQAFVDNSINALNNRLEAGAPKIAILIAGGFHTEHITKMFKDKGLSYVVISPKVTSQMDESFYHRVLRETYVPMSKNNEQLRQRSFADTDEGTQEIAGKFKGPGAAGRKASPERPDRFNYVNPDMQKSVPPAPPAPDVLQLLRNVQAGLEFTSDGVRIRTSNESAADILGYLKRESDSNTNPDVKTSAERMLREARIALNRPDRQFFDPKNLAMFHPRPLALAAAIANREITTAATPPREPVPTPGKDNVTAIAAGILHLRGDTKVGKGLKDTAAERISDAVTIVRGDREHVMAIEGELDVSYDELQAGGVHETGFIVNPNGQGDDIYVLRDDIEVTNGFHTNNNGIPRGQLTTAQPGSTSLRAQGEAVRKHGVVPEMYSLLIAANVPAAKLAEYDERPLDPLFDPINPYDQLRATIERLARDNNLVDPKGSVDLNRVEVVIMKREREQAILDALERMKQEFPKMTITKVSDGTVDPTRLALAGRKQGQYLISLTVGKSTEGTHNLFESGALNQGENPRGAVFGMRYISKNVNNVLDDTGKTNKGADGKSLKAIDQSNRFRWAGKEAAALRTFRPQDAEAIINGRKLYTQKYARELGDVEIIVPHLTDNPWFNLPGAQGLDGDLVRVWTTRISSKAAREQGTALWVEVNDVNRKKVEQTVAQAFPAENTTPATPSAPRGVRPSGTTPAEYGASTLGDIGTSEAGGDKHGLKGRVPTGRNRTPVRGTAATPKIPAPAVEKLTWEKIIPLLTRAGIDPKEVVRRGHKQMFIDIFSRTYSSNRPDPLLESLRSIRSELTDLLFEVQHTNPYNVELTLALIERGIAKLSTPQVSAPAATPVRGAAHYVNIAFKGTLAYGINYSLTQGQGYGRTLREVVESVLFNSGSRRDIIFDGTGGIKKEVSITVDGKSATDKDLDKSIQGQSVEIFYTPQSPAPTISSTGVGDEVKANRAILKGILEIAVGRKVTGANGELIDEDGMSRRLWLYDAGLLGILGLLGDINIYNLNDDVNVANPDVVEINGGKVVIIDAPFLSVTVKGEQYASAGVRRGVVFLTRAKFNEWKGQGILSKKVGHEQDEVWFLRQEALKRFPYASPEVAYNALSAFLKNPKNDYEARQLIGDAHKYAQDIEDGKKQRPAVEPLTPSIITAVRTPLEVKRIVREIMRSEVGKIGAAKIEDDPEQNVSRYIMSQVRSLDYWARVPADYGYLEPEIATAFTELAQQMLIAPVTVKPNNKKGPTLVTGAEGSSFAKAQRDVAETERPRQLRVTIAQAPTPNDFASWAIGYLVYLNEIDPVTPSAASKPGEGIVTPPASSAALAPMLAGQGTVTASAHGLSEAEYKNLQGALLATKGRDVPPAKGVVAPPVTAPTSVVATAGQQALAPSADVKVLLPPGIAGLFNGNHEGPLWVSAKGNTAGEVMKNLRSKLPKRNQRKLNGGRLNLVKGDGSVHLLDSNTPMPSITLGSGAYFEFWPNVSDANLPLLSPDEIRSIVAITGVVTRNVPEIDYDTKFDQVRDILAAARLGDRLSKETGAISPEDALAALEELNLGYPRDTLAGFIRAAILTNAPKDHPVVLPVDEFGHVAPAAPATAPAIQTTTSQLAEQLADHYVRFNDFDIRLIDSSTAAALSKLSPEEQASNRANVRDIFADARLGNLSREEAIKALEAYNLGFTRGELGQLVNGVLVPSAPAASAAATAEPAPGILGSDGDTDVWGNGYEPRGVGATASATSVVPAAPSQGTQSSPAVPVVIDSESYGYGEPQNTSNWPQIPEGYQDDNIRSLSEFAADTGNIPERQKKVIFAPAKIFTEPAETRIVGLKEALEKLRQRRLADDKLNEPSFEFTIVVLAKDAVEDQRVKSAVEKMGLSDIVHRECNSAFELNDNQLPVNEINRLVSAGIAGVKGLRNVGVVSLVRPAEDDITYLTANGIAIALPATTTADKFISAFDILNRLARAIAVGNGQEELVIPILPVPLTNVDTIRELNSYLEALGQV